MYLKETLIRVLKVKNVILLILGIFLVSTSVAILLELIVQYFGDWFTILHARATPECVIFIALGNRRRDSGAAAARADQVAAVDSDNIGFFRKRDTG